MSNQDSGKYSETMNLPKTDFPMKANLPVREPEIQQFWEEHDIYRKGQAKAVKAGYPKFILHDGPPYANGHIHIGHALNKVLKDMVLRYHGMTGHATPYIPGWDTHGLPIEQAVIKEVGLNRKQVAPVDFRRRCREYALKYVDIQRQEFKRLGVGGYWDEPYLTLKPEYEARQIEIFGAMAKQGYIYKGLKPVYWCTTCETALAEAEIEYNDKKSHSIFVRFPVKDDLGKLGTPLEHTYFIIWTTTPWTIPANLAISVHPDITYALVREGGDYYVVAEELSGGLKQTFGWQKGEKVKTLKGSDLERMVCRHPLMDRESLVILGIHVTLDQGTGCVHTAPGHGEDDFVVGQKYGLPVLNPVSGEGRFTREAGKYAGLTLDEGNQAVIQDLDEAGALLSHGSITHSYPHCWRCKHPVVFRATEQWFASVEGFRQAALGAIADVKWYPAWGQERITNMVADRHDWCISRQRVWGVPIPIFYCQECGESLVNDETIGAVRDLFAKEGSDAWFDQEAAEILPEGTTCPKCGGKSFRKETDIMDVWFDSGSSHHSVLDGDERLNWPADLYLEGSDQHRGWFQSSLLTAVATKGQAPYRAVLTHGFVVDEQGRKMSKSVGNVVSPEDVIKVYGADILRLWVTSADYTDDIGISQGILKQMSEVYRRVRNTARFLLGNTSDFDPARDAVPYEELGELDRWALLKLSRLVEKVTRAFDEYQFHVFYHAVHNFCAVELSAFYLDVIKDRLYTSAPDDKDRRAAQTVLYETLSTLVRLMAPVLVHTAEEIWQYLPATPAKEESVTFTRWPQAESRYLDEGLEERWDRLLTVRSAVSKALEMARNEKLIGNSLEARVTLYPNQEVYGWLEPYLEELGTLFIVSAAEVVKPGAEIPAGAYQGEECQGLGVLVDRAPGEKCARCWMYHPQVGESAAHPDLCPRCAGVVDRIWDKGGRAID